MRQGFRTEKHSFTLELYTYIYSSSRNNNQAHVIYCRQYPPNLIVWYMQFENPANAINLILVETLVRSR